MYSHTKLAGKKEDERLVSSAPKCRLLEKRKKAKEKRKRRKERDKSTRQQSFYGQLIIENYDESGSKT